MTYKPYHKPKPPEVSQHQIETNNTYAELYLLAMKMKLTDSDMPRNKIKDNTDVNAILYAHITDILQTISTQASAILHDRESLIRDKGLVEKAFAEMQDELDRYKRSQ